MRVATRTLSLGVAACLCGLAPTACARSAPRALAATGRVTVGVTSSGPGVAAMTFTVSIEPAGASGPVMADVGVFTADQAPVGTHVVRLSNFPGRCRADGGPEREISVSARRSTVVRFVVVCT